MSLDSIVLKVASLHLRSLSADFGLPVRSLFVEGTMLVSRNTAEVEGGGVASDSGIVNVTRGEFRGNSAGNFGGGGSCRLAAN